MTSLTRKFFSKLTTVYRNINSATLNGAIDIIVVRQEDGTLCCTPFHVRFGKLGVLQSQQTKVYITINGNPVDDLYMQLGEAGEAAFVEENLSTPVLQPTRHLEPSDNNIILDPDDAISLSKENKMHNHLSNIDCTSQAANGQCDHRKTSAGSIHSYEYKEKSMNCDNLNSINNSSVRRRLKRRALNRFDQTDKAMSEDDDHDLFFQYASFKRRSRPRKRDSAPLASQRNRVSILQLTVDEKFQSSIKLLRKRSASETDLPFFQSNLNSTPLAECQTRFHSIESRPKTLSLSRTDENPIDAISERPLSNPIDIDQPFDSSKILDEPDSMLSSILSKSAPLTHPPTTNLRHSQSDESSGDYFSNGDFSPNSSYESALSPRPTSPKSDSEYEIEKSTQQPNNIGWQWKWGEFPEQQSGSVFQYFWPSLKKTTPKDGVYLDEITNNQHIDRSMYLPPIDHRQNPTRTGNDDDQESGTGHSIPQSPFRENEAPYLLADAQLSLCGSNSKNSVINDEQFNAHLVTFESFVNNPLIIHDPNLVARIGGKYYNWNVACAMITATSIFHKQLPNETIERMQEKDLLLNKARTTTSGGWWPFYGKKSEMKDENVKSTTKSETPTSDTTIHSTTTVKSIKQTRFSESIDVFQRKTQEQNSSLFLTSNRKLDNDSEQEDSEVRKLTSKIEQKQEHQHLSSSSHQSTSFRKKMILSSDELKRLNLKYGKNNVEFSVTNAWQGTTIVKSNIFFFDHMTKFVISDIDGTITRSDMLGHIIPLVGGDWSHDGIAEFYNAIQENGYQFIYLSARAIGQSQITRNFLSNVRQSDRRLPTGPLFISPDTLMAAFYREVIAKKPEEFKIECLKNIASLFPNKNPFYAGFGNRINDQWAYTAVGIPVTRIYTINPRGEVVRQKLSQALSTSYKNLHEIVDLLFPPMDSFSAGETYSVYTYWREEPNGTMFEDEIRTDLEQIAARQKSSKPTTKNKTLSASLVSTPTIIKTNGDKWIGLAQVTEKTVKRA